MQIKLLFGNKMKRMNKKIKTKIFRIKMQIDVFDFIIPSRFFIEKLSSLFQLKID